ncbi:hypothetical protein [Rubritalea sp.]|uniref:hypothetical protein n=1 Tax=Rubritalea sp. TaxID=2109375 RepID=UPI003EF5CD52
MYFYELLAQDDGFPIQGILFLIIAVFSFLKWLYENIVSKNKKEQGETDSIDDIYEQYRDEIHLRNNQAPETLSSSQPQFIPPPIPSAKATTVKSPGPSKPSNTFSPTFTQNDIERMRSTKAKTVYNIQAAGTAKLQMKTQRNGLRAELQTKASLRKAIILREIIGPPKALTD